jgi:hypothetical protein
MLLKNKQIYKSNDSNNGSIEDEDVETQILTVEDNI